MDSPPGPGSIASVLARQRLEHRIGRVDRAIGSLVERRDALRQGGSIPPAGLLAALADFRAEKAELTAQLAALDAPPEAGVEAFGTV
jgi:hypothetical protein